MSEVERMAYAVEQLRLARQEVERLREENRKKDEALTRILNAWDDWDSRDDDMRSYTFVQLENAMRAAREWVGTDARPNAMTLGESDVV